MIGRPFRQVNVREGWREGWLAIPLSAPVLFFLTHEDAQRGVHQAFDAAEV